MELRIAAGPTECVAVAEKSIIVGPFMSRDLILARCADTALRFKQWVVQN